MIKKGFFPNKTALVTLIAACLVVIISLGIRQTFGLFFFDFEIDLGCTQTEFGFAMGIQLLFWGLLGPVFGIITDKFSGRVAVFIGFLFYLSGIYFLNLAKDEHLVRLHIGLEDPKDLIQDLKRSLRFVK